MHETVEISYDIIYCSVERINLLTFGEIMSNRESWEFTFAGAELLQAVKDQLTQLKVSLTAVKKSLAEAQKAVSKAGFSFEDGNAIGKGDYTLINAVHALRGKLDSGERRKKDLHRWQTLLSKQDAGYTEFQLKFHDHAFFFPEHSEQAPVKKPAKPIVKVKAKAATKPKPVKPVSNKDLKAALDSVPMAKKDPFVESAKKIELTKPREKIVETVHVAKT